MPAVWLPYGSTSVSIRVESEDLAWILPERPNTHQESVMELRNIVKEAKSQESSLILDPTLPLDVLRLLEKIVPQEELRYLPSFDLVPRSGSLEGFFGAAYLFTCPHVDPLLGFRGVGESLIPFFKIIWEDFSELIGGKEVDLKKYLNKLSESVDIRVVMFMPWPNTGIMVANNPVEAYEKIKWFQQNYEFEMDPVEILILSTGGKPFDESLARALCTLPNCLKNFSGGKVVLSVEAEKGVGIDPDLVFSENHSQKSPPIMSYISLCKRLLKDKTVYVVSAVPETLLNMLIPCKSYDTLLDAYKASRLFLPKGSKVGIVTHTPFISLKIKEAGLQ
ncbi:MAG: hypothetical protein ACUVQ0_02375 [Thermoproteota archaeon]